MPSFIARRSYWAQLQRPISRPVVLLFVAWIGLTLAVFAAWGRLCSDMAIVVLGAVFALLAWLGLLLLKLPDVLADMGTLGGLGVEGPPPEHMLAPLAGFASWCLGAVVGSLTRRPSDDHRP
jgi:hypothetical protein